MNAFSFIRRTGAKVLAGIALLSLTIGLIPSRAQAFDFQNPQLGNPDWGNLPNNLLQELVGLSGDVGICHATQGVNTYDPGTHTISKHDVFQQGHYNHDDGGLDDLGDIIEPFSVTFFNIFTFQFPGKNWDHEFSNGFTGEQIYNADCAQLVDQCPNIDGGQEVVPKDLVKDQAGNCVTPKGTLTITKIISGIDGMLASAFGFVLNNDTPVVFEDDGSNSVEFEIGTDYDVVESGVTAGEITLNDKTFTVSYDDCSGSIALLGNTCTITNTLQTCFDGVQNQNETGVDTGGVCAVVVNGCLDPDASNYVQNATPGNPNENNCTYEITACTTVTPLLTTDLGTWNLSETRATGHNEIVDNGLHVYTEGNTSTDKAAGYYATDFSLQDLGTQTIAGAFDYTTNAGTIAPGLQLVIDFDNNGTSDGILVGEAIYGENWWLNNNALQFVKDDAPHTGGGNGSNWFGTATEWLNAFPDAQVKAIGYSLGSGVYGDYTINKISLGCVDYTFDLPAMCEDRSAQNYGEVGECEYYTSSCISPEANLLTNASFEEDVVTNASNWQIFPVVTGWSVLLSDGLELWANGFMGGASNGNQNAELDGNDATKLTQTVATIPGATYELRFDFKARTANANDNHIEAAVDGISKVNVSSANTNWVTYGTTFVADESTDISFEDLGTPQSNGGTGTLLDNTVLCLVREPEGPKCEDTVNTGADFVATSAQGTKKDGSAITDISRTNPDVALGASDWVPGGSTGFFSLGFGGSIVLGFDNFVNEVAGTDLVIQEATNGSYPAETVSVEVSQDGVTWVAAGSANNAAGDKKTEIDFASTGLTWIKFVKLTDTTSPISHANSADGFDLDSVTAVKTTCDEPEPPAPVDYCPNIDGVQSQDDGYSKDVNGNCYRPIETCEISVVSDSSNTYNDAAAIEITAHPAWVQTITDSVAKWIWGVTSDTPISGDVDEVQTFVKTFVWSGTPSTAILKISSDNGYSVKLNGTEVGADAGEYNYQSVDTIIDLTDDIIVGVNTLEISVTNLANGQTSLSSNPGGLLYDLTITDTTGSCAPGGGDDEEQLYTIFGYVWHDDNQNEGWDGRDEENGDEEGLAGRVVSITNGEDEYSTTTDETGYYQFKVPAGTWTITEEAGSGWMHTTQESHVVTVPEEEEEDVMAMIMNFIIPTAHAAIVKTDYGEYNFGNDQTSGGGGGGGTSLRSSNNDDDQDGEVLGISDDAEPAPLVLGEQVSAVPLGAADAGAGSTSPVALEFYQLAPVAFIRRK